MAWTTPRTWVASELLTAALMNTHLRDQMQWLHGDDQLRCRVHRTDTQTVNQFAYVSADFQVADWDPQNMWGSSGDEEVTVPTGGDGVFGIGAGMTMNVQTGSIQHSFVSLNAIDSNNETVAHRGPLRTPTAVKGARHSFFDEWELAAADYVALTVRHNTSPSVDMYGAHMNIRWLNP